MNEVKFKYILQTPVKIKSIGITGKIDAQMNSILGQEFRVVYWYNGERKAVWMYEWEIEESK